MQSAIERNRKIIWIDEIMFSRTHNMTHEWSKCNTNITVPIEKISCGYTAVIAAISEGCGFEYIDLNDVAVD